MPLDFGETISQLDQVVESLGRGWEDRESRLQKLVAEAARVTTPDAKERTRYDTARGFLTAQVEESLLGGYPPPTLPPDWSVASVDGSHIDVDRHLPIGCYLINLGGCELRYGARPDARFFSRPKLVANPAGLHLSNPANPSEEEPVTGALLGLERTVRELERLADGFQECPPELPTLALLDGSLVLWGLSGQGYRPFVRDAIIRDRLLPALVRMQALAQQRPFALAAYVSLPRSTEVVNAVKQCLCTYDSAFCRQSCNHRRSASPPCDLANDFLDRDLFGRTLAPGWRSPIYRTNSSVPREHYGEQQQVYFYYLHGGEEIGRVEVPRWVAQNGALLSLSHALVLDQCQRGQGYPVAISEAHEQAVIHVSDRRLFRQMVAEALERRGLPVYTSEKERSKRTPWV
ncbi:MAG: DNA double-strand break repair nuclease NurA [Chloroflexota bacterium]